MSAKPLPQIIQGGMGAGVSAWSLANAVSKAGQLGVVAGTALDVILARRLQVGDPGGHMRRALAQFPISGVAERILERYFVDGGKEPDARFKPSPMLAMKPSKHLLELIVAGSFVEVFLAREGHDNAVGINLLEKIQLPTLPAIFGAMLGGVGYVLMGAGIPKAIPGVLDRLAQGQSVELRVDVKNAGPEDSFTTHFDPSEFCGGSAPTLHRPDFLAIISSNTMAIMMAKRASGKVNGFIVEGPSAGGHNAPPRGKMQLSESKEPLYGERDVPDLAALKKLGIPFWLAGDYARPERVVEALELGAAGVQVGTAFAYCAESGFSKKYKEQVLDLSRRGEARIFTDPVASPTGFPFKVVQVEGTISEESTYQARTRICDLGYLRHAYKKENGDLGWRCPSEPIKDFLRKGGPIEETEGRKCVCNGLLANIDLGQSRKGGYEELPMLTSGDDVQNVARFLSKGGDSYHATDVLDYLLSKLETGSPQCS